MSLDILICGKALQFLSEQFSVQVWCVLKYITTVFLKYYKSCIYYQCVYKKKVFYKLLRNTSTAVKYKRR